MRTETITAELYLAMARQGAANLSRNRKMVNDLNVFPIPDGDTGDNMYMTLKSGCDAAAGQTLGQMAGSISSGALFGARGNSGVILSRIFAGIAKGLEGAETADVAKFSAALKCGVEESYKAVPSPVEGTILTVWRESVAKAEKSRSKTFENYFKVLTMEMEASVKRTPDLLPVLKESGVVDSGGAGLLCIARGMREALKPGNKAIETESDVPAQHKLNLDDFGPDSELVYGYCTECLLRLQTSKVDLVTFDADIIKNYLTSAGDSVVCFRDGSIVKVHVHTRTPGEILNHLQTWGEFLTIKVENMTLQHSEVTIQNHFDEEKPAEDALLARRKPFGVVAVASGSGLVEAFKQAGTDVVIEGGQTMNPSAKSFVTAFDQIAADTILVFPNNSNIILTARQAAQLYDKAKILVIPSKDVGAGYVGVASIDFASRDTEALVQTAVDCVAQTTTGLISKAVRNSTKDGITVHRGDYLGFIHKQMLSAAPDRNAAAIQMASKMDVASHESALLFTGADVPADDANALFDALQAAYPRTEFIMADGGQPVYDYILTLC